MALKSREMPTFVARDRGAWREWLAANHASAKRIWLIYFKQGAKGRGVAYEDSVEEALCFGWIDSLIKRIDDTKYARLFTPRTDDANWSALNRKRLEKVIAEGRITPAGLAKAGFARNSKPPRPPAKRLALDLPRDMERALRKNKAAWENFQRLAPSYRRSYVAWITMAKKQATRERRLAEAIANLAENRKLGLK